MSDIFLNYDKCFLKINLKIGARNAGAFMQIIMRIFPPISLYEKGIVFVLRMFFLLQHFVEMFGRVWHEAICFGVFEYLWVCLEICGNVWESLGMLIKTAMA